MYDDPPKSGLFRLLLPGAYALWTGALGWLIIGRRFGVYLQPKLEPVLIGGVVLSALFLIAALRRLRDPAAGTGRGTLLKAAILVIPLAYMLYVGDAVLGSYALSKRPVDQISVVMGDADAVGPAVDPDPDAATIRVGFNDLLLHWQRYKDRRVVVTGLLSRDQRAPDGFCIVFRFIIWCCAADAEPMGMLVTDDRLGDLRNDQWIRVEGIYRVKRINGLPMGYIEAESLAAPPPPPASEQYLYY